VMSKQDCDPKLWSCSLERRLLRLMRYFSHYAHRNSLRLLMFKNNIFRFCDFKLFTKASFVAFLETFYTNIEEQMNPNSEL
jgi:hypothetical protein